MSEAPELHIVVAVANDLCIGKDGGLPWRVPEDMKHFKAVTIGHAVIMGRKTFESIGKPLALRTNIVVTSRAPETFPEGVVAVGSFLEALERARAADAAPRVIGGGEIYRAAMPLATHLHVTHIDTVVPGGDTYFPTIDPVRFRVRERRTGQSQGVEFVEYVTTR
ncbi:MAG: dihydrofolate reductase [Polyangiaceae bacterium]|nr:dihydrofolate reductase [Polyangiaceae bacterium]